MKTPGVNRYLNNLFLEEIANTQLAPLIVMLVDELEQFLSNVGAGDLSWQDLLDARFEEACLSRRPVHTTLLDLPMARRFRHRATHSSKRKSEELSAMVKETYEDLD